MLGNAQARMAEKEAKARELEKQKNNERLEYLETIKPVYSANPNHPALVVYSIIKKFSYEKPTGFFAWAKDLIDDSDNFELQKQEILCNSVIKDLLPPSKILANSPEVQKLQIDNLQQIISLHREALPKELLGKLQHELSSRIEKYLQNANEKLDPAHPALSFYIVVKSYFEQVLLTLDKNIVSDFETALIETGIDKNTILYAAIIQELLLLESHTPKQIADHTAQIFNQLSNILANLEFKDLATEKLRNDLLERLKNLKKIIDSNAAPAVPKFSLKLKQPELLTPTTLDTNKSKDSLKPIGLFASVITAFEDPEKKKDLLAQPAPGLHAGNKPSKKRNPNKQTLKASIADADRSLEENEGQQTAHSQVSHDKTFSDSKSGHEDNEIVSKKPLQDPINPTIQPNEQVVVADQSAATTDDDSDESEEETSGIEYHNDDFGTAGYNPNNLKNTLLEDAKKQEAKAAVSSERKKKRVKEQPQALPTNIVEQQKDTAELKPAAHKTNQIVKEPITDDQNRKQNDRPTLDNALDNPPELFKTEIARNPAIVENQQNIPPLVETDSGKKPENTDPQQEATILTVPAVGTDANYTKSKEEDAFNQTQTGEIIKTDVETSDESTRNTKQKLEDNSITLPTHLNPEQLPETEVPTSPRIQNSEIPYNSSETEPVPPVAEPADALEPTKIEIPANIPVVLPDSNATDASIVQPKKQAAEPKETPKTAPSINVQQNSKASDTDVPPDSVSPKNKMPLDELDAEIPKDSQNLPPNVVVNKQRDKKRKQEKLQHTATPHHSPRLFLTPQFPQEEVTSPNKNILLPISIADSAQFNLLYPRAKQSNSEDILTNILECVAALEECINWYPATVLNANYNVLIVLASIKHTIELYFENNNLDWVSIQTNLEILKNYYCSLFDSPIAEKSPTQPNIDKANNDGFFYCAVEKLNKIIQGRDTKKIGEKIAEATPQNIQCIQQLFSTIENDWTAKIKQETERTFDNTFLESLYDKTHKQLIAEHPHTSYLKEFKKVIFQFNRLTSLSKTLDPSLLQKFHTVLQDWEKLKDLSLKDREIWISKYGLAELCDSLNAISASIDKSKPEEFAVKEDKGLKTFVTDLKNTLSNVGDTHNTGITSIKAILNEIDIKTATPAKLFLALLQLRAIGKEKVAAIYSRRETCISDLYDLLARIDVNNTANLSQNLSTIFAEIPPSSSYVMMQLPKIAAKPALSTVASRDTVLPENVPSTDDSSSEQQLNVSEDEPTPGCMTAIYNYFSGK